MFVKLWFSMFKLIESIIIVHVHGTYLLHVLNVTIGNV